MQIREIRVRGFGRFYNYAIEKLPSGLTIISGPNEAGKTTLMSFIRAIFFGFPDRRTGYKRHEPLEGGEHGGSITLEGENGVLYRIERTPGSARGEVAVYYDNGVAYGEAEIHRLLKGLSEPLFQQIFCFGLDELQRLETLQNEEISGLIYSAGMGLNTRSYAQIQRDLSKRQEDLYRPAGKKPELNILQQELAELEAKISRLMANPREYNTSKAQVEHLNERIGKAETELNAVEKEEKWLQTLLQANEPYRRLTQAAEELDALPAIEVFPEEGIRRLDSLKDSLDTLESQQNRLNLELAAIAEELQTLVLDERLLAASPAILELSEELKLFHKWQTDQMNLKAQLSYKLKEIKQFLHNLGPGWTEERVINFSLTLTKRKQAQDFLNQTEHLKEDARALEAEEKLLLREKEQREFDVAELEQQNRRGVARETNLAGRVFGVSAAVAGIVMGGGALSCFTGNWFQGVVLLLLGVALAAGGYYVRTMLLAGEELATSREDDEFQLREEALERVLDRLRVLDEQKEELRQAMERQLHEWRVFLVKDGLPLDLKPADFPDLFHHLEKGQEMLRHYREILHIYRETERQSAAFLQKVNTLLQTIAHPTKATADDVKSIVLSLKSVLEEQQEKRSRLRTLQEHARNLELNKVDLSFQINSRQAAMLALLAEGGAENDADFRKNSQIFLQRQEIQKAQSERIIAFELIAASRSEEIAAILDKQDATNIEEQLTILEAKHITLKTNLDQWREERGRLQNTLDSFEESAGELSLLRQKRESLIERIRQKSEEWMAVTFCQRMLELAKERYEKERQPGVIKEATEIFSNLTGERYQRVLSPLGENRLEVEREDGRRLTPDALSRGTAEQLYLAMRLALAKEYSTRTLALPLVMDDILVNFDPARTEATLKTLCKLAADQQILFFTCHQHLVQMLRKQNLPFNHLELGQQKIELIR